MVRSVITLSDRQIKNRLQRWLQEASPQDIEQGLCWYSDARAFTKKVAARYNVDPYQVAGVVSALSPNNKWERNKLDAITVIEAHLEGLKPKDVKVCTFSNNKRKAFAILRGELISESAPKTHAFSMNIGLNSADHVTIDKWHLRACVTFPYEGKQDCRETCTSAQYRRLEKITTSLAKEQGYKGYELQAIIWVTIKRIWNN